MTCRFPIQVAYQIAVSSTADFLAVGTALVLVEKERSVSQGIQMNYPQFRVSHDATGVTTSESDSVFNGLMITEQAATVMHPTNGQRRSPPHRSAPLRKLPAPRRTLGRWSVGKGKK
jgi:hypothetical protein